MARNLPEFTGTYRAMILGNIVEPSNKAKIPTLKLRVALLEYFDEKEDEWIDVEAEHWVMTAFLALYSKEKEPSLNHQQVCKTFDWDGCGFDLLCGSDLEGMTIQVRIKDSDNEKFPIEISWIEPEDADPKGGFKKLSADDIKGLNSEFADFLDKKKAKPVKARKGKASAAAKAKAAKAKAAAAAAEEETGEDEPEAEPEAEPAEMTKDEKKKALLAKSARLRKKDEKDRKEAAEAGPPKKSSKAKKSAKGRVIEPGEDMPEDFNKKDAWFTVTEYRDEACDDDMQSVEWQAAIDDIAPDEDEDQLDAEGWWAVKDRVLGNIGKD
jgi:hypothetical protein